MGLVLMMDIRHPLTPFDCLMLDWAASSKMPIHILLTKADKLTFGAGRAALLKTQKDIQQKWGDTATIQLFSSTKRIGIEEAHHVLASWLQLLEPIDDDATDEDDDEQDDVLES